MDSYITTPKPQIERTPAGADAGSEKVAKAVADRFRAESQQKSASRVGDLVGPACNRIERYLSERVGAKPESTKEVEWLVCFDITTKDFKCGDNVERRLKELQSLADKFKGKSVAIIAQGAVCDVPNPDDTLYKFVVPNPYHIDRYLIFDGKVSKLHSVNSAGYAGDVRNLLTLGKEHFSARQVGLWIDSHGIGNPGLAGDTGESTTKELVTAIKDGLKGQPLDLLNFDCCLMAQNGVLDALRTTTGHIVASAEREGGLGQDILAPMKKLAENPKMTADDLAETMVEVARLQPVQKEVPRREPKNLYDWFDLFMQKPEAKADNTVAVQTLAHFDLSKYARFRTQLDDFGDALAKAIRDPRNRAAVDSIVRNTPGYGMFSEKRDLKCFTEAVLQAVGNGKMSDPEGKLRVHGGRVLDSHKVLVKSYSGFDQFAARGGLSTYIPPRYDLDFHKRSRNAVNACRFTAEVDDLKLLSSDKGAYVRYLDKKLADMKKEITPDRPPGDEYDEVKGALEELGSKLQKLGKTTSEKDTIAALSELKESSLKLEKTSFYQEKLLAAQQKIKRGIDREFSLELVNPENGWGRFREGMRRLD